MIIDRIGNERLVKSRVWWVLHNLQSSSDHYRQSYLWYQHRSNLYYLLLNLSSINIIIVKTFCVEWGYAQTISNGCWWVIDTFYSCKTAQTLLTNVTILIRAEYKVQNHNLKLLAMILALHSTPNPCESLTWKEFQTGKLWGFASRAGGKSVHYWP